MHRRELLKSIPAIAAVPAVAAAIPAVSANPAVPTILAPCSGDTVWGPIQVFGTKGVGCDAVTVVVQKADGTLVGGGAATITGNHWSIDVAVGAPAPLEHLRVVAFNTADPLLSSSISGVQLSHPHFGLDASSGRGTAERPTVRRLGNSQVEIEIAYAPGDSSTNAGLQLYSVKSGKMFPCQGGPYRNGAFAFTTDGGAPAKGDLVIAKATFLSARGRTQQSHTKHFVIQVEV
jgi:hypothetical protein